MMITGGITPSAHLYSLEEHSDEARVNAKIKDITQRHSKGVEIQEVFIYPLSKWHLYSRFENGVASGGEIETVRLFGLIAAFILLVACINFMNLSTARSEKRAKEVGIRKVAGASKEMLVLQFLGESLFIAFISGLIALFIVQISLPSFDILVGKQLVLPYNNAYFWIGAVSFVPGNRGACRKLSCLLPVFFQARCCIERHV